MYNIIGADDKEYGPVSGEQIRQWLTEGRVNPQTQVRPAGIAEWKPLREFPGLLGPPAGPSATPGQVATSGLAVASFILGILGLFTCGLTALVGVILGIVALVKIERGRGALGGRGLAIAGTVISGVLILLLPVLAALTLPAFARAKGKAQAVMCMNHLKQLGLATIMYASDNQERFPSGTNWCDAIIQPYLAGSDTVLQCPLAGHDQRCHYALNAQLSGVEQNKLSSPANTVLVFETDGGWNLSGGRELVTQRRRHGNAIGVVFADGHAEMATDRRLEGVRWQP